MFDGAAVATVAQVGEHTDQQQGDSSTAADASSASSPETHSAQAPDGHDDLVAALAGHEPPAAQRNEIVFVDAGVTDLQTLLSGISPSAQVIILDADRDGVEQIAQTLANRTGVDAIHLIAEGNEAELHLGSGFLTQDSLSTTYAEQFRQIGQSLSQNGDILVYGCNFGRGEAGQLAVNTLAQLTGADVAASTDRTGHSSEFGNWILETSTGAIESSIVIGEAGQTAWEHALATYTVTNTNNSGAGSLRQAILDANANAGTDTIVFNIALNDPNHLYYRNNGVTGTFSAPVATTLADASITDFDSDYVAGTARSWYRISLTGASLDVTQAVIIDGSTQAGYDAAKGPIIEINASGISSPAGDLNAIALTTGASTIRGLVINRASDNAIEIDTGAGGSIIVGNYFGTDVSGTQALGNSTVGTWGAIAVKSNNVIIGGSTAGDRNLISGNNGYGIEIYSSASGTIIRGNYIGTTVTGTGALGNAAAGVYLHSNATNAVVGGASNGDGNIIANNGGDGIWVSSGTNTSILRNSIYSNTELGVDLGTNGVTANDAGDGDSGANNLQNFPVLTSANSNTAGTTIVGSLNSNANTTYRIEFYANRPAVADAPNGEGERYLGFVTVTTNGSGDATINTTLANVWINAGARVTATATVDLGSGNYGSTSEFAANRTATSTGIVVVDTTSDVSDGTTTSITNLGNNRGADGFISLREAITAANNTAGTDRILFNIAGTGVHTITPATALPTITGAVIIDASTDDSFVANGNKPAIVIDGNNLNVDGLVLSNTADSSTIRGFVIRDFGKSGIWVQSDSDNNTIAGNYLGRLNASGIDAGAGEGNGAAGIWVQGSNNTIGGTGALDRNVLSGNGTSGLGFGGGSGNFALGNYIGVDAGGSTVLANTTEGIYVNNSINNTIGGSSATARNTISGNATTGILLDGVGVSGTLIEGNYIGTDAAGTADRGNVTHGIYVKDSGVNTIRGNVVSGNNINGVYISGETADGNIVQGNLIGTNAAGTAAIGNSADGIHIDQGADGTVVGGTTAVLRNVLSGNLDDGIEIDNTGTTGTVVQGNYIGTNAAGAAALGNARYGVVIYSGVSGTTIGGAVSGAGNVISGNTSRGIMIDGNANSATANNTIQGNIIGLNAAGSTAIGNGNDGILIYNGANNTTIGGTTTLARNIVSGNLTTGISLDGAGVSNNVIAGNYIGLNASGTGLIGNGNDGVFIVNGASNNTVGGATTAHRNVIAGNSDGVQIGGLSGGANNNIVQNNYIGTDVTGTVDLGNNDDGVDIDNAALNNQVLNNIISGNNSDGIDLGDAGASTGTIIRGNLIGTQVDGTSALGNTGHGILIGNGGTANNTTIGGTTAGQGNTIAYSGGDGIYVPASIGVAMLGNTIFSNAGLGIDLGTNGMTANDAGDGDSGANNLQNFPVLTDARTDGTQITLAGTFNSTANSYYRIEFYANTAQDGSGYGEGQRYLGFVNVATNGSGNATISTTLTAAVAVGEFVTATATRSNSGYATFTDTSEFARNAAAVSSTQGTIIVDTASDTNDGDTTSISTLLANKGADGFISLREAILAANNTANGVGGPDRILFGIAGTGAHTINVATALPSISDAVTIDATTDDSFAANGNRPAIVLSGDADADGDADIATGLALFNAGASSSSVRGFVIQNFTGAGIDITNTSNVTIAGNWIGLNAAGTAAAGTFNGVSAYDATNVTIGGNTAADRNVISGNSGNGIAIGGASTGSIYGNYIGTNAAGTAAVGNVNAGLWIDSPGISIGGMAPGQGNVISGNLGWTGIGVSSNADGTLIAGNLVGLNAAGTAALGNSGSGISIQSANNTVGGVTAAARNVVAANGGRNIEISSAGATGNVVIGNYVGTDITGTVDVTGAVSVSGRSGIVIDTGATNNRIGTDANGVNDAAERNIISGNDWYGVEIMGSGSSGNVVQGNYIGTNVTGLQALGNSIGGAGLWSQASNNRIGGGAGNVISGNDGVGVQLAYGVSSNKVQGNLIGLGADGSTVLGNTWRGVYLYDGGVSGASVTGNTIGTDGDGTNDAGERNVISGNGGGIEMTTASVFANVIAGNFIGLDAGGTLDRGNTADGIIISGGAHDNTIGGSTAVQRNVISGNDAAGIVLTGAGTSGNMLRGNYIGTDVTGTLDRGNADDGVNIAGGATNNTIGGTLGSQGNLISGNNDQGIQITGNTTTGTLIAGNYIGTDAGGNVALRNEGDGIWLQNNVGTTIGGTSATLRNVISGNNNSGTFADGIYVDGGSGHTIQGNYIGVGADGSTALGNYWGGVTIANGATSIAIGGTAASAGNVIANNSWGVRVNTAGSTGISILGNSIVANSQLGIDLNGDGVTVNDTDDVDTGSNGLQNFPVLSSANTHGGDTTVTGSINSTANTTLRIEFYSSPSGDASGNGEGQVFLGFVNVTTDAGGNAAFAVVLSGANVAAGHVVSATATVDLSGGNYGSTSEFAANVTATANAPTIVVTPVDSTTGEAGATGSFTVVLATAPTANVTVAVSVSNAIEGTVSTTLLTFTSANWNVTQTVTVTGVDDTLDDGDRAYTVVLDAASSSDAAYNGMNPADVALTNTDDDTINTVVVTTTTDTADGDTSSLYALWSNRGADGQISLREAITAANNTANGSGGVDRIHFSISDPLIGGAHTINPSSSLPTITDAVVIDASSEPDYALNANRPVVVIDGNNLAGDGLVLTGTADGSTIRGLIIRDFGGSAINIQAGSDNNLIAGNYLGRLDTTGSNAGAGEGLGGVALNVSGSGNTIGGLTAFDRNVISGGIGGIAINGVGASGNLVIGNYIGTSGTGGGAMGAANDGIQISGGASNNTIGGVTAAHANIIAAQARDGIRINGETSDGNVVQGNRIGVNASGGSLGNGGHGVFIVNGADNTVVDGNWIAASGQSGIRVDGATTGLVIQSNRIGTDVAGTANWGTQDSGIVLENGAVATIGGTAMGDGNVIAFSGQGGSSTTGIWLTSTAGSGSAVLGNSLYSNVGLGIDLGAAGVTANDAGDADTGANGLQNYAVLSSATSNGNDTTIAGSFNGAASTTYRIEFFSSPSGDATGHGEGLTFLGFVTVTTDASGNATFNTTLSGVNVTAGHAVSSTTTVDLGGGNYGSTSEFSANVVAHTPPVNTVPGAQSATEDTAHAISGISVNDVDGNLSTVQLSVGNGSVTVGLAGGASISAGANGSTTLTLSGTQAQINAALATLSYQGSLNFTGSDTLTVLSTDSLGATDSDTVAINVSAVNDAPAFSNLDGTPSFTEGGTAVVLDGNVTITDPELTAANNFNGATLTLARNGGANPDDALAFDGVNVTTSGANVFVGGVQVGTFTFTGGALTVNFGANATQARVNTLMQNINYWNWSDAPPSSVQLAWTFSDGNSGAQGIGGALQATGSTTVSITPVNDAPVLDTTKSPALTAINEDIGAPSGIVGILVSSLVDFASPSGQVDNVTDPDTGALLGLAVTAADTTNGTWFYSTNNGSIWTALGAVTNTTARLLAADATTRLYFQPNANYNGTMASAITFRAWDQTSGTNGGTADTSSNGGITAFSTATDTASLVITPVNDPPVNSVPGAQTVNEDTPLALSGVSVTDVDGNLATVQLAVGNGAVTVSLAGGATISSGANGTNTLTLAGSQADLNATLASLLYQGNLNYNGPDTLTVTSTDSTSATDVDTIAITVTGVNDPPTITAIVDQTIPEDGTTGALALTVSDVETAAGSLTVTATSSNTTLIPNGNLTLVDLGGGNWTITAVPALNQNGGPVTITVTVNDGTTTTNEMFDVTVTPVNDAPVVAGAGGTLAYTEGDGASVIDATLTITDVDNATLTGATISISGGFVSGEDVLVFTNTGTITGSYNAGTGILTLTGIDTLAAYEAALESITYQNINTDNPNTGGRTVIWVVTDGSANSAGTTSTITVAAINDAPGVTAPGAALTATEQVGLAIQGTGFGVSDVDAAGGTATATLTVGEGTLTVGAGTSGVTLVGGNGTGTVTLSGTISQLHNLLTGGGTGTITYLNNLDAPSASTTMTVTVNDGGNSGADPGLTGTATTEEGSNSVTITISAVNDAPTNTGALPTDVTVIEDVLNNVDLSLIDLTDVDAGGGNLTVILSTATGGNLTATSGGGVTVAGSGTGVLTLTGTLTTLNTYMNIPANIQYLHGTPNTNGDNADTLTVQVTDNGNTGSGGGGIITLGTVNVDITAVNDPPVNTVPGAQTVNEDTALAIPGLSVTDVDGNLSTVQLGVTNGAVTVSLAGGATISAGANGSSTLTLAGSQAQINAALASLAYQGNLNFNGSDTLTVTSTDGTSATDVDTVAITVTPVNDPPVNSVPGAQTVTEDTALAISGVSVTDVDGNLATVQLAVGQGAVTVSLAGGATISAGANGSSTLTLAGSQAQINAALASLAYQGNLNFNGSDTLTVLSTDAAGASDSDTVAITVTPVNTPPVLTTNTGSTAMEGGTDPITNLELLVTDVDNTSAQLIYTVASSPTNGRLERSTTPGVPVTTFTQADIDAGLLRYVHNGSETTTDSFTFTVSDGAGGTIGTTTFTITVTPVNDAPVNTAPGVQTITGSNPLLFSLGNGTQLAISDVDAGGGLIQVTLTAPDGTITLSGTAGLTFSAGDGTADATMTFTGTIAGANAALNGLQFTAVSGYSGSTSLQLTTNDLGNTGAGGPQTATSTVPITVGVPPIVIQPPSPPQPPAPPSGGGLPGNQAPTPPGGAP